MCHASPFYQCRHHRGRRQQQQRQCCNEKYMFHNVSLLVSAPEHNRSADAAAHAIELHNPIGAGVSRIARLRGKFKSASLPFSWPHENDGRPSTTGYRPTCRVERSRTSQLHIGITKTLREHPYRAIHSITASAEVGELSFKLNANSIIITTLTGVDGRGVEPHARYVGGRPSHPPPLARHSRSLDYPHGCGHRGSQTLTHRN